MVHILLLILKIIGIIVLSILMLALLILFFPITYVGKINGNIESQRITGKIRAGWLVHLLHGAVWIENTEIHYNIRLFGIKIKSSDKKENIESDNKESDNYKSHSSDIINYDSKNIETGDYESKSNETDNCQSNSNTGNYENDSHGTVSNKEVNFKTDNYKADGQIKDDPKSLSTDAKDTKKRKKEKRSFKERIKSFSGKIKEKKKLLKDKIHNIKESAKNKKNSIDELIEQVKSVKEFLTAKSTKAAYAYGKKLVLKLLKHLAPNRIRGNLYMGFKESYLTGEALGAIGMIYGMLNINPKRFSVYPDFENKVLKGDITFKGHIYLGVVIIYCLRFYFDRNIKRIIKKFM